MSMKDPLSKLYYHAFKTGNYSLSLKLLTKYNNETTHTVSHLEESTTGLNGDTLLHLACRHGWLDVVKRLIEEFGFIPNARNSENLTPLHYACRSGHLGIVQYLIDNLQCDATATTIDHWILLHYAYRYGYLNIIDYLTSIPDVLQSVGHSSILHFTCKYGSSDTLMYLMVNKNFIPDPNSEKFHNFLLTACEQGNLQRVLHVLKNNRNYWHIKPIEYQALFMHCCKNGLLDTLKQLTYEVSWEPLGKLDRTDEFGKSAIHYACQQGNRAIVQHLVEECGWDINNPDKDGLTPLHHACKYGQNVDLLRYVLSRPQCNASALTCDGSMALHLACSSEEFDPQIIETLMKHSANFKGERFALHILETYLSSNFKFGESTLRSSIVSCLLEITQCDPNVRNYAGNSPLQISVYPFIVKKILACYAQTTFYKLIEYDDESQAICEIESSINSGELDPKETARNGDSILHMACAANKPQIAKYLLNECNFDPNIKNCTGDTPLSLALRCHAYRMLPHKDLNNLVSLFLSTPHWNPVLSDKHKDGNTLLHLACKANQKELVTHLEGLGGTLRHVKNKNGCIPFELLSNPNIIVDCVMKGVFIYTFIPGSVHQFLWFSKILEKKNLLHILAEDNLKIEWQHKEVLSLSDNCRFGHHKLYLSNHQIWLLMRVCFHSHTTGQEGRPLSTNNRDIFIVDILDHVIDDRFKGEESNEDLLFTACRNTRFSFVRYLALSHNCNPDVLIKIADNSDIIHFLSDNFQENSKSDTALTESKWKNVVKTVLCTKQWDLNSWFDSKGDTVLHLSVKSHRHDIAHYLITECKCDPNIQNQFGETSVKLLLAAVNLWSDSECIRIIKAMTSNGLWDPNSSCNPNADTALHLSAMHHRVKVALTLLTETKSNPNTKNERDETPIQLLLSNTSWSDNECVHIIKLAMSTGKWDPNSRCNSNGDTALHLSAIHHRVKVALTLLIEIKCNPNTKNKRGETPIQLLLSIMSWSDSECDHIIKFAMSTGKWDPNSRCNSNGDTSLYLSAMHHRVKVALTLLTETKCDPDIKNETIQLLFSNTSWSDSECIQIIKSSEKWDPNSRYNSNGETALHLSVIHHRVKAALTLISETKCNPNTENKRGETPIQLLLSNTSWSDNECVHIIKHTLSTGKWDPNSRCNSNGDTALHLSVSHCRYESTQYLLSEAKCDPNIRNLKGEAQVQLLLPLIIRTFRSDFECKEMIKALISTGKWNPNSSFNISGDTALHLSARHHRAEIVHFLLSEINCDPNVKNIDEARPSEVTYDTNIIDDLIRHGANPENVYKSHGKFIGLRKPLIPPVKVFIIGNSGVGKSTLTEALKIENPLLVKMFTTRKRVSSVDEKTAGIVPHEFESSFYGRVIFYDFAGHREFYNSHIAILQNVLKKSSPIFLIVVNFSKSEEETQQNLHYWLYFLENNCNTAQSKPHVIIIGSHADIVLNNRENPQQAASKLSTYIQEKSRHLTLECVGVYPVDCRYSESSTMTKLRNCLKNTCKIIRISDTISLNAHCFYAFLLDKFETSIAVTIDDLQNEIEKHVDNTVMRVVNYIPDGTSALISVCNELNDRGHILFLKNNNHPKKSWVIIDKMSLLSKVTGTIFAPKDFKEHCQIAESTGVVPLSRLTEVFPDYNSEVLVGFLTHLEFCHKIDDQELHELITKHQKSLNCATTTESGNEHYFLFPGLITLNAPSGIWKQSSRFKHHCFWTLKCSCQNQFFSTRFTQVLLLRLAFTFALIKREARPSIPALLRECSIWKNGIFWGEIFGMETVAEIHTSMVILLIRCSEENLSRCIAQRSSIIQKILHCVHDVCSNIETVEYFIDPAKATMFPVIIKSLGSSDTLQFSSEKIAEAIVKSTNYSSPFVVSSTGTISLDYLLTFEPYAEVGISALKKLCTLSENDCMKRVSDSFLKHLRQKLSRKANLFCKLFESSSSPPYLSSNATDDLYAKLTTWRDECNGTYKSLKHKLDQHSIFAGRSVLELAALEISEDISGIRDSDEEFLSEPLTLSKSIEQSHSSVEASLQGKDASFIHEEAIIPSIEQASASNPKQTESLPDLHDVPKLHQLHLLECHGKRVKVIDMVAAQWDSVAIRLHFESYDVSRIERDYPQQSIQATVTVFKEWIKGKGRQPPSWHTLIKALKETRLQSVTSDLESIFMDQFESDQLIINEHSFRSQQNTEMKTPNTNDDSDDVHECDTKFETQCSQPSSNIKPKLAELQLLEGHGKRIRLVESVADQWKDLAVALDFDDERINSIDSGDPRLDKEACLQMFEEWLGEDDDLKEPVTWTTLVQCLIDAGMIETADVLKEIICQ